MRAVVYARVSHDPHGLGRSVEEQETDARVQADREGWDVVRVYVDPDVGASRFSNGKRPEFDRCVEFLRSGGADILVTWEASRAQRDLEVYVQLREVCRKHNVLWSYSGRTYDLSRTDDAFTTGLDALLAERESAVTRDRVLRSMRASATNGRPHGKRPYGYRRIYDEKTGALVAQVIDEPQATVVREAARRVLAGETPYAVAQDFNRRGIPTPTGKTNRWDLNQIKRICVNPTYIAKRVHRGTVLADVQGQWPKILDDGAHYALVEKLTDPARRTKKDSIVKHLLTGIARCGVCGAPARLQKNRGYLAYMCSARFCVARRFEPVDDYIRGVAAGILSQPEVLARLTDETADEEIRTARTEAAERRTRLQAFYDAGARGELSPAALSRIEARLIPEIEADEQRARQVAVPPVLREVARAGFTSADFKRLAMTTQREIVELLMTVEIMPVGKGRGSRSAIPITESVKLTPKGMYD